MRVLVITGSFPPMKCGVGDYSYSLAKAIAVNPEMKVGVLTSVSGKKESDVDGIDIFPVMKNWECTEVLTVIKILNYWSPDIVHIQYPTQGYGSGLLPRLLPLISFVMGKKVVQTWHEVYSRRDTPELIFKSLIPSGLVVVRQRYKEDLHPALRWTFLNKKFVFIRNASAIPNIDLNEQEHGIAKRKYLKEQKRLIVFFGFVHPNKGVELLFDIADPSTDQIVIAGEIVDKDIYQKILNHCSEGPWHEKVTITGFTPLSDVAVLLSVADAVILPFRVGGGEWNTSIHATILQKSFVITTSHLKRGYDDRFNVYYAKVDDVQEMKLALNMYGGRRRKYDAEIDRNEWQQIASEHCSLYDTMLSK